jgi:ketosteroid isomerase-like protein
MASTQDVLHHHLKCFGEGNVEGILADYSLDAVLLVPTGTLNGLRALREFFQAIFTEFGKPGTTFTMHRTSVEGDYAYIFWSAETADNRYEAATDTFVVRDGKIMAQSFAAKITLKH